MKNLNTYLTFNGNCKEAMTFYNQCLGGDLRMMTFADMPCPEGQTVPEGIMHASLSNGDMTLMASDVPSGMPVTQGNNFSININCESLEEIERLFPALGSDGKVLMALHDAFWGARFGMLTDKFGINWMFNFEQGQPHQQAQNA